MWAGEEASGCGGGGAGRGGRAAGRGVRTGADPGVVSGAGGGVRALDVGF